MKHWILYVFSYVGQVIASFFFIPIIIATIPILSSVFREGDDFDFRLLAALAVSFFLGGVAVIAFLFFVARTLRKYLDQRVDEADYHLREEDIQFFYLYALFMLFWSFAFILMAIRVPVVMDGVEAVRRLGFWEALAFSLDTFLRGFFFDFFESYDIETFGGDVKGFWIRTAVFAYRFAVSLILLDAMRATVVRVIDAIADGDEAPTSRQTQPALAADESAAAPASTDPEKEETKS